MTNEQVKAPEIKAGRVYHFRDDQESSVYQWARDNQRVPLTITRVPDEVRETYKESETIELAQGSSVEGSVSPTELAKLRVSVSEPLKSKDRMIIFGTGSIDYLVNQNDMAMVTRFLENLRNGVYRTEGIVAAELNLEDAERKPAYQRLIRTAPLYEWPILSAQEQADKDEDVVFADDLDKLLEKKMKYSENLTKEDGGNPSPFIESWPGKKKP